VIGSLVVYGVLQEKIMSCEYGGERFSSSVFLVLMNRLVALVFAVITAILHGESLRNVAPLWKYVAVSVSNVYASACQYEALKYVSFPVQILGKSFKMMPVMVWGMAVGGKHYTCIDWAIAVAISGGVFEFLMTGPISPDHAAGTHIFGYGLLCLYLVLDGFTSTYQEVLFREYRTSTYNQMIYINLGSSIVSYGTVLLASGFRTSVAFIDRHPPFLVDVTVLSGSAVAGQWFIYAQVKEFGALVFAATLNVRQVVSILVSYGTYGHSITALQIVGLVIVFSGFFIRSFRSLVLQDAETETASLVSRKGTDRAGATAQKV